MIRRLERLVLLLVWLVFRGGAGNLNTAISGNSATPTRA